ncbi:hypothetical protein [Phototrophicus methaneseepsis]|nr:hypothetical protein [Phototrophicus methaneseepsis]
MGHSWPWSQRLRSQAEEPTQALSATDVIWAFFASHTKVTEN